MTTQTPDTVEHDLHAERRRGTAGHDTPRRHQRARAPQHPGERPRRRPGSSPRWRTLGRTTTTEAAG